MKENHPFSDYLNIEITSADPESAEGRMKLTAELTDALTHVTGGAYTSLADAVGGAAARATGDMYVTQNCSLQFYVSTEVTDVWLLAEAKIRHRGTRSCIAAVELKHEDGTIVCDGQLTYAKI